MRMLRWCAGAAVTAGVMLVAACGSGGSTPGASHSPSGSPSAAASASAGLPPASAALAKQVNSALKSAKSVHMTGAVTQNGSTATIDIALTHSNDVYGQFGDNSKPFTVLVTQGHGYIKVSAAATLQGMGLPSSACQLVCGKYLELSASESKSMLGGLAWSGLWGQANSVPKLSYVRTATVAGQSAWEMKAGDGSTVYLAAQGTHYPLQVVQGSNRIAFTQWNSATIPGPPPASQVINIDQLKNLGSG
jgi:hypothetical protein